MASFYLKFNSKDDSINYSNAVSIDDLGEILKSLFKAISAKKSDNVVLSIVSDNCYLIGVESSNPTLEKRFEDLNNEVLEKNSIELTQAKLKYKKAIAKPLKENWYIEALNSERKTTVTLPYGFNDRTVEHYYSNKSFEGYVTLIGDKELDPKNLHIYLSDHNNFKIFIDVDQHEELASFYRRSKIRAKVRLKKSLYSNRILSAQLINYRIKSGKKFPFNLDDINLSELNFVYE